MDVARMLDNHGLNHTESIMYRTVSTMLDKEKPFDYDMLVFFTPSGVQSLKDNFPDFVQGDIQFGCFGDSTAKAIQDKGFRLDMKAPNVNAPSITRALELFLEEKLK